MKFLKTKVNNDQKAVERFLSRGLEAVFPSKESFGKVLMSGKRISIYLGIDPTGPTLHMGHAIPLMKLSELQAMGHKIILLMGDFTAMIGDPSDKMSARKQLSRKEVLSNLKLYKKQASKFLKFTGGNAAEIRYNSKWLSKMSFEDVVNLASKMTVDQMLKRDMFRKRMEEGKPVFLHEFLYPLMQGYDSVAMDVDAEIGGNDQTFNMLAGRDLMRALKNKEKAVIAVKLLVDPSGKKMGKTEGNMITLEDTANDMFGKVMSWTDGLILSGYELCTRADQRTIDEERSFLESGGNPRDAKIRLAESVVEVYYGKKAAEAARQSFINTFSSKSMQADAPEATAVRGDLLSDILLKHGIVSSKTEWRRLVSEKAVREMSSDRLISAHDEKVSGDMDLKVGKHRFLKVRLAK